MTEIRMEDPYGEFKRVEISLNNFSKSIQNNMMKRFGFFPDSHKKLFEKSCQVSDSRRKADMSQELKEHVLRLFENMWLNELFLYQTEKILGNDYLHFFFQEYISFYYSLFTGIPIISRILYLSNLKNRGSRTFMSLRDQTISGQERLKYYPNQVTSGLKELWSRKDGKG